MRAAVLLGGPIAEREEVAKQVSFLYNLRSAAAHGEDLDPDQDPIGTPTTMKVWRKHVASDVDAALTRGRQLCGHIARRILQLGFFPNYRRMMLGEALPGES
jgi:hypothetical protein